jgi:hypothetical protein
MKIPITPAGIEPATANVKVQNVFQGRNNIRVAQTVNTEQLQDYASNMVCFRHILVNTQHKDNNKDNSMCIKKVLP